MIVANDVDVLMLAECDFDIARFIVLLNSTTPQAFHYPDSLSGKIKILTRLVDKPLIDLFNDPAGGLTIRRLNLRGFDDVLLAVLHYPSRVNWNHDDQTLESPILAQDIRHRENETGINRTIVVGDFNMNPFDAGVIGAQALHAVMTKQLARRGERDVHGRPYKFFYNPMWQFFGDRTAGPPGTYYLRSSKPGQLFWNIYDQVIVSPSLMDSISDVQILDTDGSASLLTRNGLPSETMGSDHLPILFKIDL